MAADRAWRALRGDIAGLNPACFDVVMSTGIVSLAAQATGHASIARALLWLNVGLYLLLILLTVARLGLTRGRALADLTNYGRAPGALTTVAGTCLLGRQLVLLEPGGTLPVVLLALAAALWLLLGYWLFVGLVTRASKPPLEQMVGGSWLLMTVSAQSLAILCSVLAPTLGRAAAVMHLCALACFVLGVVFYVLVITILCFRMLFHPVHPRDLGPSYWITMGAVASSTLAGTTLVQHLRGLPLLEGIHGVLVAATLLCWVTATWWLPALIALGLWRHLLRGEPLGYSFELWTLVFPLGMYTTATAEVASLDGLRFLEAIPRVFVWVALLAWLITLAGLLRVLWKTLGRAVVVARER